MRSLRVPGTTIAVTLLPGYVEVRDKGMVKKKIPVRNRSFEDVAEDLEIFFKAQGKILPPGTIADTLIKIGVPRAKRIISQTTGVVQESADTAPPVTSDEVPSALTSTTTYHEMPIEPASRLEIVKETEPSKKIDIQPGEVVLITEKDMPDIEDALYAVERLSDSFMAPTGAASLSKTRPQIKITVQGVETIEASDATIPSEPSLIEDQVDTVSPADTTDEIIVPHMDEMTTEAQTSPVTSPVASVPDVPPRVAQKAIDEEVQTDTTTEPARTEEVLTPTRRTPIHAVKPLVSAKAVLLGEDGVGKHSLVEKAQLRVPQNDEGEAQSHIRSGLFQLDDYRVNLNVWLFDDAAQMRISRKEFYDEVDVIIIIYAVSDRWSFESIDFWLREATIKHQKIPPVVIVGNKKDIRDSGEPDPLEPAVTSDEGFKMAETLAKRLGDENNLHPVAFIETSCLTGEGTTDVFKTASEFYTTVL